MNTQSIWNVMAWKPQPFLAMVFLLVSAALPLQAQTLIYYYLNDQNIAMSGGSYMPNAGTLGNGIISNGFVLTAAVPTNGVPPGSSSYSIYGLGNNGVLAPGTKQLNNAAINAAGGFTYETWFYWTGSGNINAIIDYAGTLKLIEPVGSTGPEMQYYDTNNSPVSIFIGAAASNQWHYVAVVFTSTGLDSHTNLTGNFAFYLDTNTVTGTATGITISPFGDSLNRTIGVGMHPVGFSTDFFHGLIYAPRVTLGAFLASSLLFKSIQTVTTTNDAGAGSLRSAISNAPVGGVITFATNLSGSSIALTNSSGALTLGKDVTIDATPLPNGLAINGNGTQSVFHVLYTASVVFNSLTITNGYAFFGGGILNSTGKMVLNNCTIANNAAFGEGGGGIANDFGNTTLNQCTISSNLANAGGGIYNQSSGTLRVNQCTISSNSANPGAGIWNGNQLYLSNSVVAGNTLGVDLFSIGGATTNLSGTNLIGGNALLAPLGNYGGPTQTMPPLFGSPLLDACVSGSTFATDQRGYPRLSGTHADIGAVEAQYAPTNNRPRLTNTVWSAVPGAKALQFIFTNTPNADFSVLVTPNAVLPIAGWLALGEAIQISPGQYQFIDTTVTNSSRRYYKVVSP